MPLWFGQYEWDIGLYLPWIRVRSSRWNIADGAVVQLVELHLGQLLVTKVNVNIQLVKKDTNYSRGIACPYSANQDISISQIYNNATLPRLYGQCICIYTWIYQD